MPAPTLPSLSLLLFISGSCALSAEVIWMRRAAVLTGSTGVAITLTLAGYMAGLGIGAWFGGQHRWRAAPVGYARLEAIAAVLVLLVPLALALLPATWPRPLLIVSAATILGIPAVFHGATLPAISAAVPRREDVGKLYAANTAGAVLGTLLGPFFLLPLLGLQRTEWFIAGILAALVAWTHQLPRTDGPPEPSTSRQSPLPLAAVGIAGAISMALEVLWTRLAAMLVGASVHAMALTLAVFLAGIALGARLAPRWGSLASSLTALGLCSLAGLWLYGLLPYGLGAAYDLGGPSIVQPAGAVLMALAMGGAPVASGMVFTHAVTAAGGTPRSASGAVLAANTAGGVLGSILSGLVLLPGPGLHATALACGILATAAGAVVAWRSGRPRLVALAVAAGIALAALAPAWNARLYAAGLYLRLDDFADLSPRGIHEYADGSWDLRYYRDGSSGSVAVGQSRKTGNLWLSVNGKVDASTGDDMPTQVLSGRLPLEIAGPGVPAVVVGLASGITAAETLRAGASEVTVIEIEPRIIEAARLFEHANHGVVDNPSAQIVVDDARAWLTRPGPRYPVIISEPSNPWITGVSSLFTREYWQLSRQRLTDGGVFVQWVQLYSLPPEAFRGLVRTFIEVYPRAWLFETIPGSDALLIAAPQLPGELSLQPTLGPEQLERLAGTARLNTDDDPWVELAAPKWLHRSTAPLNRALIERSRQAR